MLAHDLRWVWMSMDEYRWVWMSMDEYEYGERKNLGRLSLVHLSYTCPVYFLERKPWIYKNDLVMEHNEHRNAYICYPLDNQSNWSGRQLAGHTSLPMRTWAKHWETQIIWRYRTSWMKRITGRYSRVSYDVNMNFLLYDSGVELSDKKYTTHSMQVFAQSNQSW